VVAERPKWDSKLTSEENFAKLEEEPKFWTVKVETSPGDSEDVFSGTFEECEKFVLNSK